MIIRTLALVLVLVTAAVVQTSMLPMLSVAGFRPDVLLLVVIAFAVHDGAETGVRLGFAAGLVTDLLLETSAVGVAALTFSVVGYLVGIARPYLAPQSITAPLLLAFGGSMVGSLVLGLLTGVLGDGGTDVELVVTGALFVAVVHTIVIGLVLRIVRAVSSRFPAERIAAPR